jgi:hypothetical protein
MALELTDTLSAARTGLSTALETARNQVEKIGGAVVLGALAIGGVNLDVERAVAAGAVAAGVEAGSGLVKPATGQKIGIGMQVSDAAMKLAEHELTEDQRKQLAKDREAVANASPWAANISGGMPTRLMRQVLDRATAITADAEKEAETRLSDEDKKKLPGERKAYEEEMKAHRIKMGTILSLTHNEAPPSPGPTMLKVKELGQKILNERAAEL